LSLIGNAYLDGDCTGFDNYLDRERAGFDTYLDGDNHTLFNLKWSENEILIV
jgi:hypothetical protein